MSGDRLAHIEARIRLGYFADGRDVLALVEIAKQARTLTGQPFGQLSPRDFYKLREEVARLDSGATEDARTSSEGGRNQEHLSSAKAAPSPDPEDSGAAEGDA